MQNCGWMANVFNAINRYRLSLNEKYGLIKDKFGGWGYNYGGRKEIHCKKYLFWKYSFQYLGNVDQL